MSRCVQHVMVLSLIGVTVLCASQRHVVAVSVCVCACVCVRACVCVGLRRYLARFWNKTYFAALAGIQSTCEAAGIPMAAAALRWLKFHSQLDAAQNDGIIIGASSLGHLSENIDACDTDEPLPEEIVAAFEEAWHTTKPACPKYFRP